MKKHSSKKTFLKILLILSLIAASVTILSFLIDMKNSSPDNVSINITQVGTISSDDLSRGEVNNSDNSQEDNKNNNSEDSYKDFHNTIHSENELKELLASGRKAYIDNFPCLNQVPELPTGCEVTSLTMVLNYLGYDADKTDIAANYLEKGDYPDANPNTTFVGTPFDKASYGCFAPVITDCANLYGAPAVNISGASIDQFCQYVENGQPVIVWATMNMESTDYGSSVWIAKDGQLVIWPGMEHCLVMIGFDSAKNEVYMADPLNENITTYNFSVFYQRWLELGCQGVIVDR